jgi:hypothetical protein
MVNYSLGKIYEIVCRITGEKYIGSTFQPRLSQRLTKHVSGGNTCMSKQIIDRGDYFINLIENYPCTSCEELRRREREITDKTVCINLRRAWTSNDEKKKEGREYANKIKLYLEELANYNLQDYYMTEQEKTFDPYSNKPDISATSRKLYLHNLTKLNGGKAVSNLKFLSNADLLDKINEAKPNTRRTYLISVVSALKDRPEAKFKKLYAKFYEQLVNLNKELKDNTEKTPKVKENWVEQDDVKGGCPLSLHTPSTQKK